MRDYCCTLAITPRLRELFRHLARREPAYQGGSKTERVGAVLLDQLAEARPLDLSFLPRAITGYSVCNPRPCGWHQSQVRRCSRARVHRRHAT